MNNQQNLLILFPFCVLLFLLAGCLSNKKKQLETIEAAILDTKREVAPDKRVALFDLTATLFENTVKLIGEVDDKGYLKPLEEKLSAKGFEINNLVMVLPDSSLQGKTYGIINNSVANLRSEPRHSAELATQATLGTVVKVLKKQNEWYLIQTPDKYISWVDHGGLVLFDKNTFDVWSQADKIIFEGPTGFIYSLPSDQSEVIGDMVAGSMVKLQSEVDGYYEVAYPDGRIGFVKKTESSPIGKWKENLSRDESDFIEIAKSMIGAPYLWGGTSTKGVDCSGFTKTIYFMNGFVIPRDASQQVNEGMVVDEDLKFEGLEIGDLLFFGKKATDSTAQKTTHVGMWIGDGKYIHSSKNVKMNSVIENAENYDEANVKRYLGSRRYLNNLTQGIIDLKKEQ